MKRIPSIPTLLKRFPGLEKADAARIRQALQSVNAPGSLIDMGGLEHLAESDFYSDRVDCALEIAGVIITAKCKLTFDVETLRGKGQADRHCSRYRYINAGDTYATTLIANIENNTVVVGCWGDLAERGLLSE